jgi:hypothetical protein
MADRILFVSWGQVVRGREERALEVFNDAMGIYGRRQQEGLIEGIDVALLSPSSGLGGYFEVQGSAQQLNALREDDEWRRNIVDAQLVVDDLRVVDGFANEGVARQLALYQEAIAQVPQRA